MQETQIRFLGWEDPLEKEMATHSSKRKTFHKRQRWVLNNYKRVNPARRCNIYIYALNIRVPKCIKQILVMDREAWHAAVHGSKESDIPE